MSKTDYICDVCRKADKEGQTHPGAMHTPGICDCECRNKNTMTYEYPRS